MARRGALVRNFGERHQRSELFEILTRPQRSLPARLVGLATRLRAELFVFLVALLAWAWLSERVPTWLIGRCWRSVRRSTGSTAGATSSRPRPGRRSGWSRSPTSSSTPSVIIRSGRLRSATRPARGGSRAGSCSPPNAVSRCRPFTLTKYWHDVRAAAGLDSLRFHDLRHTAVSLLLLGVPERAVMEIMGWSNSAMATRYQHLTGAIRADIAGRVGGLLWGPTETQIETLPPARARDEAD